MGITTGRRAEMSVQHPPSRYHSRHWTNHSRADRRFWLQPRVIALAVPVLLIPTLPEPSS